MYMKKGEREKFSDMKYSFLEVNISVRYCKLTRQRKSRFWEEMYIAILWFFCIQKKQTVLILENPGKG